MDNIIDLLKGQISSKIISQAAEKLGESESGITNAIGGLVPTILGGLIQKSSDNSAFSGIFNMLKDEKNIGFLDNLGGLIGGGNLAQGDPKDISGGLMSSLFGNKTGGILDLISSISGTKKSSSSSLLGLVGPLLMGYLGKKIKKEGLNISGLASFLIGQKSNVMKAMPAGMGDLLGFGAGMDTSTPNKKSSSGSWKWWVLALAILAAIIYFWKGCNEKVAVVDDVIDKTEEIVEDAKESVTDAVAELGQFFKHKLGNGIELNIPENGIEAQLIKFIEDKDLAIDKNTWYNFDRITFDFGKTTLDMSKSAEQLKNIAEIMKSYPNTKIKIGGYTDSTGSDEVNMNISQQRADNVMKAIMDLGVAADRMRAEGYGKQHPVASNDTEEGRAKNRRMALRFDAK